MLTEPLFWVAMFLLGLIIVNYVGDELLRARVDVLVEHDRGARKLMTALAELVPFLERAKGSSSLQSDTNVHQEWELIRLRESVLELDHDLRHVFSIVASLRDWIECQPLTNHVVERHTRLPDDLPSDVRDRYQAGKWSCPICNSLIDNCWSGWCPTCGRVTAAMTLLDPVLDHEPTLPGVGIFEEFTCFGCRKTFLLKEHPLTATCPHCGIRQIDIAIS